MLTIQILTNNDEKTIQACLNSINFEETRIVVGDLGSTDSTRDMCMEVATVVDLGNLPRNVARNKLLNDYGSERNLWLQPWEYVVKGMEAVKSTGNRSATILQNNSLMQEVRTWDGQANFANPIFEKLDAVGQPSPLLIFSQGHVQDNVFMRLNRWKKEQPLAFEPYYYEALMLFSQGKYDEFFKAADHYLFMDKKTSPSVIMMRYYYAMGQIIHRHAYRPALQNLNLCLCHKPLMAEFWCLMGDVYYHLLKKFSYAKKLYENAMILGSKRLQNDDYPLEISKYKAYPLKMIESCRSLLESSYYTSR